MIKELQSKLKKSVHQGIECEEKRKHIVLEGVVDSYDEIIRAGYLAARDEYKGVVNRLKVDGLEDKSIRIPTLSDHQFKDDPCDVLVIGGGIIGCAIIRWLSKYNLDILLVDKESDIAMHQSSRNDGMVHPGFAPKPGSNKAVYNVKGNQMFEKMAGDLEVPFKRVGTYMLFEHYYYALIKELFFRRAEHNNMGTIEFLFKDEILKREPFVTDKVKCGIYMPTTAVCPPYEMTVALAENAVLNGARVSLETYVYKMQKDKDKIMKVYTNRGEIIPKVVINCAGLSADFIAELADDRFFTIHPRKGQIAILDKNKADRLDCVLSIIDLKTMKSRTKGGGLVKTVEGNIVVGPSAYEQPYKEDYSTTKEDMDELLEKNLSYIKGLSRSDVITYTAGNRAATYKEDFIIEKSDYVSNLIHIAGIQSPGYASSPAIAEKACEYALEILKEKMKITDNERYDPHRKSIPRLDKFPKDMRSDMIMKNRDYGHIICRCEHISKGEIIDAIHSPIPAVTLDAIKRRTRGGMGRCQGGFCTPLIMEIIKEETDLKMEEISKKGKQSHILYQSTRVKAGRNDD
ncbi:MAG: FAD-dependent oxidoreductase [Clostridia bacterium]|nr:FAD-dependent oxidoreductase [Clostridia bacterium]